MAIQFKVEYEIPALRFVEGICPKCGKSFDAREQGVVDWNNGPIHDAVDLKFAKFNCPNCGEHFETRGEEVEIKEL